MAFSSLHKIGLPLAALLLWAAPGVAQNEDAIYFQKTLAKAQAGDAEAMEAVAGMYLSGTGAPKPDVPAGLNWERKAAQAGSAEAQLSLGDIYFKAQGQALKCYDVAAIMEYPTAKGLADKLRAKMAAGGQAPKSAGSASAK